LPPFYYNRRNKRQNLTGIFYFFLIQSRFYLSLQSPISERNGLLADTNKKPPSNGGIPSLLRFTLPEPAHIQENIAEEKGGKVNLSQQSSLKTLRRIP